MIKRIAFAGGAVAVAALVAGMASVHAGIQQQAVQVTSQYVSAPPQLDGIADAVWDAAPEASFAVVGGANTGSIQVLMKSVYTLDRVYFLFRWDDPTESFRRFPWVKQTDGSWKRLTDGPSGDENVYYEDKLAVIWNIDNSISGFNQAGCMMACHAGEAGKPFGNKYTSNPGEKGDIWHWKSVRTGSVGFTDDQYLDDARWSATVPEAGRHSDPSLGGGYKDNKNEAGTGPAYMAPGGANQGYWLVDSDKVPFVDTFQPGDEIASILVAPLTGDRADLPSMAQHSAGGWTLEVSRTLVTGSDKDVQFGDPAQPYYFGVAVFDNAQVRHSYQLGVSELRFSPRSTAVAQSSWGVVKQSVAR
ncbi:MAG: ethylbenzene dehydrogenase-related protein [Candidatus Latescibacterota bacterium]|jgi:hypothetical protein